MGNMETLSWNGRHARTNAEGSSIMGQCPIAIRLIFLVGEFAIKVIAVSWLVSKHLLTLCDTE